MYKIKIIGIFLIIATSIQVNAQVFKKNDEYISSFVISADSLLKTNKSIAAAEAKNAVTLLDEKFVIKPFKATNKKRSPAQLYSYARKATVIVGSTYRCSKCAHTHVNPASGYIIDKSGVVVTNYHVLKVYADMGNGNTPLAFLVKLSDGRTYPVKSVLAASQQDDLAILQLDTNGDILPSLNLSSGANIGDPVYVLGHPHNIYYHFSQGIVTQKYSEPMRAEGNSFDRNLMLISADYGVGSSGGPVMDQYGNIVGTVSATQTLNYSNDYPVVQMILKKTIPVESIWKLIRQQ